MQNETHQLAKVFDLTEYESKIYLSMVGKGPMHLKNISKHSSIPRTAIYRPLEKLMKKGLVSETVFGKRKYYSSVPIKVLRYKLDEKRNQLENLFRDLMSSKQIYSKEVGLEATMHLGAEGIKSAGLTFLEETTEKMWYSFENLASTTDRVGLDFEDFYIKERVKRGIKSKMILSVTEETQFVKQVIKKDQEQLRETILLSPHQYPFNTTVVATKGMSLLINPNRNPFALLLRNDDICNTFIQMHKCISDRYKS